MFTRRDGIATCFDLYDATHRKFTVGHFAACSLAFMNLSAARDKEIRIDRRVARELSYICDHFARHNQLPQSFPEPDFMI
jgi:hypothetical protein